MASREERKESRQRIKEIYEVAKKYNVSELISESRKPKDPSQGEYDEELDYTEEETLGWVMLFISLFWFVLNFWYGWSLADSYHYKMFWNLHNSIIR